MGGLGVALAEVDAAAAATDDGVEILMAATGDVEEDIGTGADFQGAMPDMSAGKPKFHGD